jgi:MinD-like ATPase involved in chromosome partitioning or flagellar assembly
MRVFVLARTQSEIVEQIYPALVRAGADVVGYTTSVEGLAERLRAVRPMPDLLLVQMTLSRRGEEQAFLESLPPTPLAVVLPRGRADMAEALATLPRVTQVAVEPVDYAALLAEVIKAPMPSSVPPVAPSCVPQPDAVPETVPQTPPLLPALPRRSPAPAPPSTVYRLPSTAHRLIAFASGMLGGTGKSTLAGTLAWLLAQEGKINTLLLSLGTPPAALSHFKLARWPDLATFLNGEECFERVVQRTGALHVALSTGDPVAYDRIGAVARGEAGAVLWAVEEALARYDVVIADLPSDSTGWAVHPLLAAADVVLVVRPTVADQSGLVQALALLKGLSQRTHLALNNRRERDIDGQAFTAGVGQMVPCPAPVVVIPHTDAVGLAQNEGVPLALAEGSDDVLSALRRLAAHLGYALQTQAEQGAAGVAVEQVRSNASSVGRKPGRQRRVSLPGIQFKLTD